MIIIARVAALIFTQNCLSSIRPLTYLLRAGPQQDGWDYRRKLLPAEPPPHIPVSRRITARRVIAKLYIKIVGMQLAIGICRMSIGYRVGLITLYKGTGVEPERGLGSIYCSSEGGSVFLASRRVRRIRCRAAGNIGLPSAGIVERDCFCARAPPLCP